MSHLEVIQSLRKQRPHDPLTTVLETYAYRCFLRYGEVPKIINYLLPMARKAEQKASTALFDQKRARPWVFKHSPDQPRVPAGNPDGGQWTSIEGDEWPHPSNGQEDEKIRVAVDLSGFTKHGINQTINRDVNPSAILDALNNPIKIIPKSNGTTRYIGRKAVVVLNPLGQVVTVWGQ